MEDLINSLKKLQANVVSVYSQAHGYHWNVEGMLFKQLHAFFLEIYEDVYDSIDTISENIRKIDGYAPFGPISWSQNATILINDSTDLSAIEMINELISSNSALIDNLNEVFNLATVKYNEQGLSNFLAERLDKHKFWNWQLKATLKKAVV